MLRMTALKLFMNFYDTQFTLLTPLINQNYLAILPHQCSTTVSLETYPFILLRLTCNYPQLGQPSIQVLEKEAGNNEMVKRSLYHTLLVP